MPTATTSRRIRAPRTDPRERRRQLLDAAEQLLASVGSDALRMDAVARAAGVTRPVVYEHFGDRDGLIIALLERHAALVRDHVRDATTPGQPFDAALRAGTRAYLEIASVAGRKMRALTTAQHLSPAIEAARSAYWSDAADAWADRYRHHAGLPARQARALATAHLAGLAALAGLCADGDLSVARATDLHVTSTIAALEALRHTRAGRR